MSAVKLLAHFRQGPDGTWTAVKLLHIKTVDCEISIAPGASFAPGATIAGVDLVAVLNAAVAGVDKPMSFSADYRRTDKSLFAKLLWREMPFSR